MGFIWSLEFEVCDFPDMFNLNYLELFILNTIIYFDLFDYPLTLNEIYTHLFTGGMVGSNYSLTEIASELKTNPKLNKIIATERGFYFLQNRQKIIQTRLGRYVLAEKKWKIALWAGRIFKYLPFVKLIAVCNSLAYNNAKISSDIDFFIVTAKNRIWQTRLFLIFTIAVLGLRPPKNKQPDKICLSFYLAEDDLDLTKIKIASEDIYLVFWLATLLPIYMRDEMYDQLIAANPWLNKYLPNWQPVKPSLRRRIEDNKFSKFVYQAREFILQSWLGDWLENLARQLQIKHMSQKKKDLAVLGDKRVIISDTILKFHENDRRAEYQEKFEKKREELLKNI